MMLLRSKLSGVSLQNANGPSGSGSRRYQVSSLSLGKKTNDNVRTKVHPDNFGEWPNGAMWAYYDNDDAGAAPDNIWTV